MILATSWGAWRQKASWQNQSAHSYWQRSGRTLYCRHSVNSQLSSHVLILKLVVATLIVLSVHQQGHPAGKNRVMRCWCGYLSGTRCRLFAHGPADATAPSNPIISCLIKIHTGFTFLVLVYLGRPNYRTLNGCSSSCLFTTKQYYTRLKNTESHTKQYYNKPKYRVLTVHTAAVWCPSDTQEPQTTHSRQVQY